jgi:hypothetical protein
MECITVTFELDVFDESAFRQAAYEQARRQGCTDAQDYLDKDKMSLNDCARINIDPGSSPAGSQIL